MNAKGNVISAVLTAAVLILGIIICSGCIGDAGNSFNTGLDASNGPSAENSGETGILLHKPVSDVETEMERYICIFTNEERVHHGIPALSYDSALSAIAKSHSADMAQNGFFEHTNPQGQSPSARAEAAGYPVHKDLGGGWYSEGIGENIFAMPHGNVSGVGYVEKYDSEMLAKEIVDGWMESPGHRENILNTEYSRIGIGVSYDGVQIYYATQDFW